MKDALGHGSNPRGGATTVDNAGNHQTGVLSIGRPMKVQLFNPGLVGQPWQTIGRIGGKPIPGDRANRRSSAKVVAERVALRMKADERSGAMRRGRILGFGSAR
jgi:hypothetical protein